MASLGHLLCVLLCCSAGPSSPGLSRPYQRGPKKPIIGILMQKCRTKEMKKLGKYYIAASYVKYLESAGARVVPIRLDLPQTQYTELFRSINGLGALRGRMFRNFPAELLVSLALEPLTANFHKWSLSVKNFTENAKLKKVFNILTTNTDGDIEFISSMEGFTYPVYAVQCILRKPPYEWKDLEGISHAPNAV
ncbi:gamma-glutamyl hydrolase [Arvicola amphibius]|uniref:gamma-glutamyl hydrolase n=1 Tax=Arvicola amphibius TaxID=1047088 RepID=UPI001C08261E|nr:gamma-glutamyl hydrolase [Arvicola amphibius]